jgi:hypothetical protein
MKITEFKKGDLITRIQPTYSTDDWSYIGDKIELLNVENGIIYCKVCYREKWKSPLEFIELELNQYFEGWEFYINKFATKDFQSFAREDSENIKHQMKLQIDKLNEKVGGTIEEIEKKYAKIDILKKAIKYH